MKAMLRFLTKNTSVKGFKSQFTELFGDPNTNPKGWKMGTLADCCSSIVRGPFGSSLKKEFFVQKDETTYKVYEQKNAIQKNAALGFYHVTNAKYQALKRFECMAGDIIMSCSGTMGELFQLPPNAEHGIINQALCKFKLNESVFPIVFLMYLKETIGNLERKGSGIQNIAAVSYVKNMPIPRLPLPLQTRFAEFVQEVDKSKFGSLRHLRKKMSPKIKNKETIAA
jgi:type I restriction enzyme S subunit